MFIEIRWYSLAYIFGILIGWWLGKKIINHIHKYNEINFNESNGVIYTGNPKILKQICPGVFGTIKPVGYCMIGKK